MIAELSVPFVASAAGNPEQAAISRIANRISDDDRIRGLTHSDFAPELSSAAKIVSSGAARRRMVKSAAGQSVRRFILALGHCGFVLSNRSSVE
jgi:hypothetical protein